MHVSRKEGVEAIAAIATLACRFFFNWLGPTKYFHVM